MTHAVNDKKNDYDLYQNCCVSHIVIVNTDMHTHIQTVPRLILVWFNFNLCFS